MSKNSTVETKFIDTNIFIRFFTKDDPQKAARCKELFQTAKEREVALRTTETVVAEVVYILSSPRLYKLKPSRIRDLLLPILALPNLKISLKTEILAALDIYAEEKIDFEDAILYAQMRARGVEEIYSYDTHFDRLAEIKRREP